MGRIKLGALACIAFCASASAARAHISLEQGGTHTSRYGDDEIKDGPCGRANGMRGTTVHTYKPGETINITVVETIPHPGYFRIAFDQDGHDGFEVPSGTDGMGGNCAGDPKCGPGMADFCNNETVLLDNLSAHSTSGLLTRYTFTVTLPNVECDNCTLQVIQMMNDLNVHRAAYPADDIYYQCIDIVLSSSAMDVNVTPVTNSGMVCEQGGAMDAGTPSGTGGTMGTMDAGVTMAGTGSVMPPAGVDAGTGVPAPGTGGSSGVPVPVGTGGMSGVTTPPPGGMTTAPPTVPGNTPSGSGGGDDGGGCSASGLGSSQGGALAVGLALLALSARRRART